ncbi:hypothetical protein TrRE_jg324, partial [Triparma retinervis]
MFWLYNPIVINISTRGSSDSLLPLLPVLFALLGVLSYTSSSLQPPTLSNYAVLLLAGFFHGLSVHGKIYPVIYSLSYALHLGCSTGRGQYSRSLLRPLKSPSDLLKYLLNLMTTVLRPPVLVFVLSSLISFSALTYISYAMEGEAYLTHGILYHSSRLDHRHNYSIHWYYIYLSRYVAESGLPSFSPPSIPLSTSVSLLTFLPQSIIAFLCSIKLSPGRLPLSLFLTTLSFVCLNKVYTAQYFLWYLPLALLSSPYLKGGTWIVRPLAFFLLSVVAWLLTAGGLEHLGYAWHLQLHFMGLLHMAANV